MVDGHKQKVKPPVNSEEVSRFSFTRKKNTQGKEEKKKKQRGQLPCLYSLTADQMSIRLVLSTVT